MKKYILLLIYILLISNLYAELPPYVYENLKKNSPEVLKIKVRDVNTSNVTNNTKELTVEAKVLKISTSKSGLKVGDVITIVYSRVINRHPGWVGPSPIPLVERGEVYYAFLRKDCEENYYTPAARGESFE